MEYNLSMNAIIFSDVDGTLYDKNQIILDETKKDIKYAQKLGLDFVIVTGNPFFKKMKDIAEELNVRYIATSNGAQIFDCVSKVNLLNKKIPSNLANQLLEKALELQLASNWWDEDMLYFTSTIPKKIVEFWNARDGFNVQVQDKVTSDPYKLEFHAKEGDEHKIDEIQKIAEHMHKLEIARFKANHLEVTFTNISKGEACKMIAEHLNVPLANAMAIGDSDNDRSMFAVVKHSYAMDNAPERIKELCAHFTSDVTQNGLGEAIQDFIFRMGHRDK